MNDSLDPSPILQLFVRYLPPAPAVVYDVGGATGYYARWLVSSVAILMDQDNWDETAALHVDPFDAVPRDFVRRAGSAAGQINIADDFNATPDEFEE